MSSWFEIHRSNFKLDSDRYQIGVSFELRHEHFDAFRAYARAMEIMTRDGVEYLLLAEDTDAINAGYYKFEREEDGSVPPILPYSRLLRESAVLQYLRLLPKARL